MAAILADACTAGRPRADINHASTLSSKARCLMGVKFILVAFASKGAHPSQISAGHSTAIDRLLNREVSAAVLALVSTDSAEGFPDIPGFKVFQVPIPPEPGWQPRYAESIRIVLIG